MRHSFHIGVVDHIGGLLPRQFCRLQCHLWRARCGCRPDGMDLDLGDHPHSWRGTER